MGWEVPLVEIEVTDEDIASVLDCLRSGWLTMGPRTQDFEAALGELVGTSHALAVSSGTGALHLACRAVGVGPGDEVIVPAMTFAATAHAPRYCGADVVLCDSASPTGPNLDVESVRALIGPRTKAVIAVHMWGYAADAEAVRQLCDEQEISLIEDCAEAIGARTPAGAAVGSVGDLGCFSFFSKKQLAVGEGGMVSTDDDAHAASVRSLRTHAMTSVTWERHKGHGLGYDITDVGYNYRIDEPRAALGLSRLRRLAEDIERRREVARTYRRLLAGLEGVELPFSDEEVERASHFAFPVLVGAGQRDGVREALRERGVQSTAYPALHQFSLYRDLGTEATLPQATAIGNRHLTIPIHASLKADQVEFVAEQLAAALRA